MSSPPPRFSVVLADDTADIRMLTRLSLEMEGDFVVVGEAADGHEALAEVESKRPDLLVLDLAMPMMDGLQVIPKVVEIAPDTKVVVLSGFEASAMAADALRRGAHDYIQKGTSRTELIARLRKACGAEEAPTSARSPRRPDADFVAMTAHELRNPIAAVLGSAETLEQYWDSLDEPTKRKLVSAIARQGVQLKRLVSDLLALSRLEAGSLPVNPADRVLAPILETAVANLARDIPNIEIDCPSDLVVHADPDRVEQMVSNYLTNAGKYGVPPVLVSARAADGSVEIRVRDHGDGVPQGSIPRLFERYSEAANSRRGGIGLGLYIVRGLAEAQGGEAWYEESPGGGACFVVRLPTGGER